MAVHHIPPIQCLVTFEALARLRHAGRAADELCVTPSAVTHRIRQLESHIGFKLFGRSDFSLTADGVAYLANVRSGLAVLQDLPTRRGARGGARLRVAITPTFCRQFVMPRLETFRTAYPDIDLVLQVSIPLLDVTAEECDLEVRFGTGGYTDVEHRLILEDAVTPVCSPSYLNEFGPFDRFETKTEIQQTRLIRSPLEPWSPWFSSCGIDVPEPMLGGQFNDIGLSTTPRPAASAWRCCARRWVRPGWTAGGCCGFRRAPCLRRTNTTSAGSPARWTAGSAPRSATGCSSRCRRREDRASG